MQAVIVKNNATINISAKRFAQFVY